MSGQRLVKIEGIVLDGKVKPKTSCLNLCVGGKQNVNHGV